MDEDDDRGGAIGAGAREQKLAHQFRLAETKARHRDLARRLRAAVEDEAPTEALRQQFEATTPYAPSTLTTSSGDPAHRAGHPRRG